ncbi:MAG: polysaccharide biosynthesis tyrosine autokinase [Gemmataceae bacterium]|nr:polysaccharide biosynthesis tyrosine autokinase [Gemmataceae bacterium]MDW8266963.1 polysaccharide biosynthesis tyrosine autokinase [Gemmataceae bacterium]
MPLALPSTPDGPALLRALRRRWLTALSLGLLVATLAAAAAFFLLPPRYTATVLLQVALSEPHYVFTIGRESRLEYDIYKRTQLGLIKSRLVLNAALRQPGIADLSLLQGHDDPISWLEEELKVESEDGSEILRVSLSGPKPAELAAIVNAVKDAYWQEIVTQGLKAKKKAVDDLEQIKTEHEQRLRNKRLELQRLQKQAGTTDPQVLAVKQRMAYDRLSEAQREHARVQGELRKAQMQKKLLEARRDHPDSQELPPGDLEEHFRRDPTLPGLLNRLERVQARLDYYLDIAVRADEPVIVRTRKELQTAQEAVARRKQEIEAEVRDKHRRRVATETAAALEQLGLLIEQLERDLAWIAGQLEELGQKALEMSTSTIELEMKQAEIAQESQVAEEVARQWSKLRIEHQSPPRVSVLQAAEPPTRRDWKRPIALTAFVGAASFGLVVLGIAFAEFRARRVSAADDVRTELGLRVVGSLPSLPQRLRRAKAGQDDTWKALMNESVDSIRTLLLREAALETLRVVMVSSAVEGEGKTTLASHLAASLARAGRRTLLLDCDLRRPALHQLFEAPLEPGFADVLRGEVSVPDILQSTGIDGLTLAAAGVCDADALAALARDGLAQLFQELRTSFDFVVVDSFPILAATDSLLIGQHVDGVILSVLSDVSRTHCVHSACQRLEDLGIRLLGAVVGGDKVESYRLHAVAA